jgi:hypothetical protein
VTDDTELLAACNRLLELLVIRPNLSGAELEVVRDLAELRARLMTRRTAAFSPHTICVGPPQ